MAGLQIVVVTPEKTAMDEKCDYVALPLFDGELGVLPGRAPMIGRLAFGEMRVKIGSAEKRYYIDGGFVQVDNNVVSVLTSRAILPRDIDLDAAKKQLEDSQSMQTPNDDAVNNRIRIADQARAQIRMAENAGTS
jgi:F-type H+-transporting ATPase subunit epsilon